MKKSKIKTIVCILLVFSLLFCLCSCNKNRKYDEQEVRRRQKLCFVRAYSLIQFITDTV